MRTSAFRKDTMDHLETDDDFSSVPLCEWWVYNIKKSIIVIDNLLTNMIHLHSFNNHSILSGPPHLDSFGHNFNTAVAVCKCELPTQSRLQNVHKLQYV